METISKLVANYIVKFAEDLEKLEVEVHSFALVSDGQIIAEEYYNPVKKEDLQRVFSISKSFTALAVGLLADEGKINLTDSICKYFTEYIPDSPDERLLNCTILDCLMMRSCHTLTTYDKFDMTSNWVKSFFTTVPDKVPGSTFNYDTSAAHVLSALVERLSGMKLMDYIRYRLPALALSKEAYMLTDGQGVSMGGSGLVATLTDLISFGKLLLACSLKDSKPDYLSDFMIDFLHTAVSCLTPTKDFSKLPFEGFGYGYMIWQADHQGFVCYGMGGQFIMVHPKEKLIFVVTSNNIGESQKNQLIFDCFYKDILLNLQDDSLVKIVPHSVFCLPNEENFSSSFFYKYCHKWSLQKNNNVRVFTTLVCESEINNESEILLSCIDGTEFCFRFGFGKNCSGIMEKYGMRYCASASIISPDELIIRVNIIDTTVGWILFKMKYTDDCKSIVFTMEKHEETMFSEFQGEYIAFPNK